MKRSKNIQLDREICQGQSHWQIRYLVSKCGTGTVQKEKNEVEIDLRTRLKGEIMEDNSHGNLHIHAYRWSHTYPVHN